MSNIGREAQGTSSFASSECSLASFRFISPCVHIRSSGNQFGGFLAVAEKECHIQWGWGKEMKKFLGVALNWNVNNWKVQVVLHFSSELLFV